MLKMRRFITTTQEPVLPENNRKMGMHMSRHMKIKYLSVCFYRGKRQLIINIILH